MKLDWQRGVHLAGLLAVAMLLPIVPFLVIGELPGERWLEASGSGPRVFAAVGALLLSADVLLPIPSSVVGVLLGGRLGFAFGAFTIFVGLCVGHCLGYWLGRAWPSRWSTTIGREPGFWALLLSRPVPIAAEAMTFAAGALGLSFTVFLRAIVFGNFAYATTLAAVGSALLPERAYWLALALLLALGGGATWLWRRVRRG